MSNVFDKFGGIRPMASKIGLPVSTVKSWDYAKSIPAWRRDAILAAAAEHGISLSVEDLVDIGPSSETDLPPSVGKNGTITAAAQVQAA